MAHHTARPAARALVGLVEIVFAFVIYLAAQLGVVVASGSRLWAATVSTVVLLAFYQGWSSEHIGTGPARRRARLVPTLATLCAVWLTGQSAAIQIVQTWPGLMPAEAQTETVTMSAGSFCVLTTSLGLAPIAEEVLMRGIVYRVIRTDLRVPVLPAALVSACLFAALHANIAQAAGTVLLGILAALLFEQTGSVIAPIAIHMLFNLSSWVIPAHPINALAHPGSLVVLAFSTLLLLVWLSSARSSNRGIDGMHAFAS